MEGYNVNIDNQTLNLLISENADLLREIETTKAKLTAYEETGLEPDEVAQILKLAEKINVCDLVKENLHLNNKLRHAEAELARNRGPA